MAAEERARSPNYPHQTTRSRGGTFQEAAPETGYGTGEFPGGGARTQQVTRVHSAADVRKTDTKASILALGDASLSPACATVGFCVRVCVCV